MKYIFITFARLRILRGAFNKTQGHFVTIQKFNFAPSMKNGTALEISIIDQALGAFTNIESGRGRKTLDLQNRLHGISLDWKGKYRF